LLRLKLIACKALFREFSLLAAKSKNFIDVTFMQQGLHDTPLLLHQALQAEIDKIDSGNDLYSAKRRFEMDFDAIILGYGLCSNAIIGLVSQKYKLAVARCDDCIALLLGSYKKYRDYFKKNYGTYWYSSSWIENAYTPSEVCHKALLKEYTEKYGEDNASYLCEVEYTTKNYNRCAYVQWDKLQFPEYVEYTQDAAKYFEWDFEKIKGHPKLLMDLVNGNWDKKYFLVVPPGMKIKPDYSGKLIDIE
jgi:hypothetical protein